MKNDVGPAASTSRAKLSLMPRTTDDNATTTNTPTATPMIVRMARTLLARIDSMARVTPSRASRILLKKPMLFLPERFDGVEERRSARRIDARDDAHDEPEQRRGDDRPRRDGGGEEGEFPGQSLRDRDAERDADQRAEGAERRRLDEKL